MTIHNKRYATCFAVTERNTTEPDKKCALFFFSFLSNIYIRNSQPKLLFIKSINIKHGTHLNVMTSNSLMKKLES